MPPGKTRNAVALAAGIGAYRHAARVPTLRYAARDARALARVLADPVICAFPPDRVTVLTNRQANRAELVKRLSSWLPEQGKGADLALIYFAGHGIVQKIGVRDEGYLLPYDADPDNPIAHGIAMADLARWIEGIEARAVVVCLDCCHAGYLPQEGVTLRGFAERDMQLQPALIDQLAGKGRFLIASCDRGQKSIEAEELRHGLFTYHLLAGLTEAGDRDGDGKVSVAELFAYVSSAVSRDARERFGREQTPWTSATYTEEVILSTVAPGRRSPPLAASTANVEAAPTAPGENTDSITRLRELRRRPDPVQLPFIFRHLADKSETVRSRARQALRALTWDRVMATCEQFARKNEEAALTDVLDGLAALEAHAEVVALLDRLAGVVRGPSRDRVLWLLDRKRLALERERLAEVFREKNSNYEIVKVLGPGLYTGAYLARQELTGLEVVVRVLRPEFATQPVVRAHFLDLAARAVRLVHQNLVLTREVRAFNDAGLFFAVRDFIDGPTLREVLASGRRFEPAQAVSILRQVAEALTPLHADGQSHGGIKPSNIFLTRNDRVVLGDPSLPLPAVGFDLPRLAYDFRYASPELFRSGELTPASDLYSLGCVAHELFRGTPPFVSDSPFELIARHERDPLPAYHDAFQRLLSRLLCKSPADRLATIAEVLAGLLELTEPVRAKSAPMQAAPASVFDYFAESQQTLAPGAPMPEMDSLAGLPAEPPSVHLLRDQSLMQFEDRESIVPLTHGGGPMSGMPDESVAEQKREEAPPSRRRASHHLPPDLIPGYEILGELGRGGMGVVYKARQTALDRIVALKVILSGHHAGEEAMARFRREAQAVAGLQHPNILQVFDFGEHNGQPFLALEFCGGGSLMTRLHANGPAVRSSAETVALLAGAMQYVHEKGIVHRDLKPANVLLDDRGSPKITDFGLARRVDGGGELTMSGAIMGTPSYMAPEQAEGRIDAIGPGTDIYSLGTILYELFTGQTPFKGKSALETLQKLMNERPASPRKLNADVPRELESICLKCLEKDPRDRYASAAELAEDLRRFLAGTPIKASPKRRWWPFGR